MVRRVIVDENDNVIGAVAREELDLSRHTYRASGLWLRNTQGDVLIAQRGFKLNSAPGLWGPAVSGTVEENETYEENIYKEADEEIGLIGQKFVKSAYFFSHSKRKYWCQYFTAVIDKNYHFIREPREVESVKWMKFDDLASDINKYPEKYIPYFVVTVEKHRYLNDERHAGRSNKSIGLV